MIDYLHGVELTPLRRVLFLGAFAGGKEVEDTASGNPLTFVTDLARPLKSLVASFLPVQAGTGDPSPENVRPISGMSGVTAWHTGKNLFNKDGGNILNATAVSAISNNSGAKTVFIQCKPLTKYTVSKLLGHRFSVGYTKVLPENGVPIYDYIRNDVATEITVTTGADAQYLVAYVYHNSDDVTPEEMIASVQIEVGETATAYSPYVGESYPVTFPATGKNLFHCETGEKYSVTLTQNADGSYSMSGTADGGGKWTGEEYLTAGTYAVSINATGLQGEAAVYLRIKDENNTTITTFIAKPSVPSPTGTFTIASSGYYTFSYEDKNTENYDGVKVYIQIENGSSASTFEPYTATIYGGSVDLVTGVLTAEWALVSKKWSEFESKFVMEDNTRGQVSIADKRSASGGQGALCNVAKRKWNYDEDSVHFYTDADYAVLTLPNGTDESTDVQIVYPLATPLTYQLTPQQVTALIGDNTIWSDANGDCEVTYLKKG